MVRFHRRGHSLDQWKQVKAMLEHSRRRPSLNLDEEGDPSLKEDKLLDRGQGSGSRASGSMDGQQTSPAPSPTPAAAASAAERAPPRKEGGNGPPSDIELMKEKFAKLLLGEDMSGGGKGVSSALAISNAITNLAASVFGEQRRLEPMSAERKTRWRKEVDWLLSVSDHIVEFVPSKQVSEDGKTTMEIMITQQRKDLRMNIPALRKLDAMLIEYLDNFKQKNEFWYVSRDASASEKGSNSQRSDDKWWLPTVRVPANGLSEDSRKWLQHQKELVHQVLKAAMAINANVIMEMEIPEDYIENLPKNGRSSLGESLYKNITDDDFDAEAFLSSIDLSTEHKILDLKNRIEASVVIWKRKMHNKDTKSSWSGGISMEKREQFEDRAETILLILKHRFPGIPQSSLDISKIQYNKDVGYSILESYSRVLESLAFTVMSRIEDVLRADATAQDPSLGVAKTKPSTTDLERAAGTVKPLDSKEEMDRANEFDANNSMTLSDFMGWQMEQDNQTKKEEPTNVEKSSKEEDGKFTMKKPLNIMVNKKFINILKLETWEA
ncbi:rho guanine nucleotide exchange factor 8-like [Canna indica]|uniref:Rho guanine nucleotide exchange factor 8-like n=1 Tax=Canna indica TaxID=4628 RepID=A0AAQ3Q7X3_9LILI|nr:rho guanine nucleotide exchange factor 8-like [Canna indica]